MLNELEFEYGCNRRALVKLKEWVSKLTKIAKVALSENPKLLEKIGISVTKKGTGRKKAGIENAQAK